MDITIQMRTLVEELNRASDAYYNGRGELMTDYEWDAKFDQLKQLVIRLRKKMVPRISPLRLLKRLIF